MEEFIIYTLNFNFLSSEMMTVLGYVRYLVLAICAGMLIAIVYFIISSHQLEEKYFKDLLAFTKTTPYQKIDLSTNWSKIENRAESDDPDQQKLAIIEADDLIFEALQKMEYEGEDLEEALEVISEDILPNKEELLKAHKTRRDMIYDPSYELETDEAEDLIEVYKEALDHLQVA